MENNKYKIVITEVEPGNLDSLRAIMNILNVDISEAKTILSNTPYTICMVDDLIKANNIINELERNGINTKVESDYDSKEEIPQDETVPDSENPIIAEEKHQSHFKQIVSFIGTCCTIIFILFLFTAKGQIFITDIIASINSDGYDNPYIEMVQNLKPFDGGESYAGAFARTFDKNTWTYFKSDNGLRIVQITSTYKDIPDEKMITQILVSPTSEKNQFFMEPYAINVSGQDLTEYEMNMVLASVFKSDVVNELGELFFSASLY